jgi:hypothetical protein
VSADQEFLGPGHGHRITLQFSEDMKTDSEHYGYSWIFHRVGIDSVPASVYHWTDARHVVLSATEIGESPTHEYSLDYTAENYLVENINGIALDAFANLPLSPE